MNIDSRKTDLSAWMARAQNAKLSDLSGQAIVLLYIALGEKAWKA